MDLWTWPENIFYQTNPIEVQSGVQPVYQKPKGDTRAAPKARRILAIACDKPLITMESRPLKRIDTPSWMGAAAPPFARNRRCRYEYDAE
jgi:hypothetical protein